jgi:predicted nucleotidyltransferase
LEQVKCPKVDNVVDRLRAFDWSKFGAAFAVVFGSSVSGKGFKRDIDVAVWIDDLENAVEIQHALSRYLGVAEQCIDIVMLNNYEFLPCTLVIEALGKGKPVYYKDLNSFLDTKLRILFPCFDFMINAKKLKLLEAQIEAVMRSGNSCY